MVIIKIKICIKGFSIGASYNRFNQIDDIVVPLEAKVGKLIKADDVLKAGEELSKVATIN